MIPSAARRRSTSLEPYLDGDLDAGDADRLRAHLAACSTCAAEARPRPAGPARAARPAAAGVPAGAAGAGGPDGARRGRALPAARGRSVLRWIAAAAAVVALAVGGGSLFVHLQHVQQQREQVAQATREARLALAYFGKVTRRTSLDVRDEVLRKRLVIPVTRDASQSLSRVMDAAGEPRKEL